MMDVLEKILEEVKKREKVLLIRSIKSLSYVTLRTGLKRVKNMEG